MEKPQWPQPSLKAAIESRSISSHSYAVKVPLDHCYGEAAHGGFVVSAILSAVKNHFSSTLRGRGQPHTFDIQLTFLRSVRPGQYQVNIKDAKLGAKTSTVHFAMSKSENDSVVGYASNINMDTEEGLSYLTSFVLQQPPPPANFTDLLNDCDPQWATFTFPWSQCSYLRAGTQLQWFTPTKGAANPSIIDIWFTPLSPEETFTTEMVGSLADQWGCLLDNMHPFSVWSTEYMAAATKAQDLTLGTDLSQSPVGLHTSSISMQFKKNLPPEGVKWLFVRAQAKRIQNGRSDMEVIVLDEGGDLVAVSLQTVFFATGPRFAKKAEKL